MMSTQTVKILNRTEDWVHFTEISTLCQKAGVGRFSLIALIAKELTDNALDESSRVEVGYIHPENRLTQFYIQDWGEGFSGTDEEIANYFNVKRPMLSTKRLRLPTRGALGNGLRVVTGGLICYGGYLTISTKGRTLKIIPKSNGTVEYERISEQETTGTRIEIYISDHQLEWGYNYLPALYWAEQAVEISAHIQKEYTGKPSPYWYNSGEFFNFLLTTQEGTTTREVLTTMDGCSGAKAGKIAKGFPQYANQLTRAESEKLLEVARANSNPTNPNRLGYIGEIPESVFYHKEKIDFSLRPSQGSFSSQLPAMIEYWLFPENSQKETQAFVNHTPIVGDFSISKSYASDKLELSGCNVRLRSNKKLRKNAHKPPIWVNITTPYMPIVSDGKAPDFSHFKEAFIKGLDKIAYRINQNTPLEQKVKAKRITQKDFIREKLEWAINRTSGNGEHLYTLRQLFYTFRPEFPKANIKIHKDGEKAYKYFCKIIQEIEFERGDDLPGILRNDRGHFIEPHEGKTTSLGTKAVDNYIFPKFHFNKVLFIEKEGYFEILRHARFGEKYDCAIMSSSGFSNKATRDLIDKLYEYDNDILFFCVHDCDASGTLIYNTLQEATTARGARKCDIIDFGFMPDEVEELGLKKEELEYKERAVAPCYEKWKTWFYQYRVELNEMTTPQFLTWLEGKMEQYDSVGKLIPPDDHLRETAEKQAKEKLRDEIEQRVLKELEETIETTYQNYEEALLINLETVSFSEDIETALNKDVYQTWTTTFEEIIDEIVSDVIED